MMMEQNLGKLKKTIKDKCPDCGGCLQLRTRGKFIIGENRSYEDDYLYCPRCQSETEVRHEIRRFKVKDSETNEEENYGRKRDTKPTRFNPRSKSDRRNSY